MNNSYMLAAVSGLALCLTACASAPDYREASASGAQGYSTQKIEANRWRVSYTGDERQSAAEVRDLALRRAAELTLQQGADWFETVGEETTSDTDTKTRFEDRGFETDTVYERDCGLLGCTTRARPITTYGGVDPVSETSTVFDHSMTIIIHNGLKPLDNPNAYEASQTAKNLAY